MRIGLEVSALASPFPTGIARYMKALAAALREARPGDRLSLWYRLSRLKHRHRWWRPSGMPVRTWQDGWWPPVAGLDLFHGLDGAIPDWRHLPRVATVHDLTVLRDEEPETARESFRQRKRQRYRALAGADRIIVPSEATMRDVVALLDVAPERVRVIPHGVEERFRDAQRDPALERRLGLRPGYLLFVGAVSQRKNTKRLVRAFARSRAARDRQLVLAGRVYHRSEGTRDAVRELKLDDRVVFADHAADADLPSLYAGATALVFPTLYEGFGLPILEAMAAGTPVLCADRGAAPETAGGLAVTVNPHSIEAIAEGIDRVLEHPPATPEALRDHSAHFTWQRAAVQTAAVYSELLGHG